MYFSLLSLLSAFKEDCFYEAEKQLHFCHFYIVCSQQTMCFSLACGSKNITKALYGYRLHHLFPLSQNYLLQNGAIWGISPHKPYRQHKLSVQNAMLGSNTFPILHHHTDWQKKQSNILCQIAGIEEQHLQPLNFSSAEKGRKLDESVSPELHSPHEPPEDLDSSVLY